MSAGSSGSTRRPYRSPRRAEQAAQNRAAVLAAAVELFSSRGWAGTGMRDVARAAGVAVETVYSSYRSKVDLLLAAVDVGVVGDAEPVALAARPEFTGLASGSPEQRAAAAARLSAAINERTAGLHLALEHAAAADAEAAAQMRELEERRRMTLEQGLALVAGRPVTPVERDGVWALTSVEMYRMLIDRSGWTVEQYRDWLTEVTVGLLDLAGRG